jgi:ArsR family transcriptional regulator, virulence genes transcriptional regulator
MFTNAEEWREKRSPMPMQTDQTIDFDVSRLAGKAEQAARLLTALGQSKRLLALCHLVDKEMSVGALAEAIGLGQSALSQHLARLRDIGVVATRREGQTIHYRLASDEARQLIRLLYEIYCKDA